MRLRELPLIVFAVCAASAIGAVLAQGQDTPQTRMRPIGAGTFGAMFPETETVWAWTQPAEHHKAVVRVSRPKGAGTGVMIQHGGPGAMILTAAHVLGPYNVATMTSLRTGNKFTATAIYKNESNDVAVLHAGNATPGVTLGVANFMPERGDLIEVTGLGGPGNKLRHFSGKYLGRRDYDGGLDFGCDVISGDSGSPVVYKSKAVVGLVRGGSQLLCRECESQVRAVNEQAICPRHGVVQWPLNRPTQSDVSSVDLADIVKTVCQRRGWQPLLLDRQCVPCQPTQPAPGNGGGMYPPDDLQLKPPANGPTEPGGCCGKPGPAGPAGVGIKSMEIVNNEVIVTYTDDRTVKIGGLRVPAGADGSAGKDAFSSDEEKEAFRLSIIADIISYIDGNPAFKGPKGDDGDAGADGIVTKEQIDEALKDASVKVLLFRRNEIIDSRSVKVNGTTGIDIFNLE